MIKSAKCNFINEKAEENKSNPRELWKLLNDQLGCSQKLKTKFANINIKTDEALVTDKLEVANYLNRFFTSIATTLVNKLPLHSGRYGVEHITAFYNNLGVCKEEFKLSLVTNEGVKQTKCHAASQSYWP